MQAFVPDARDREDALLARCVDVARGRLHQARDAREANVFRAAGMTIVSRHPAAARRLMEVCQSCFAQHPHEQVHIEEVIRRGWVSDLPRLREMLGRRLNPA